MIVGFFSPIKQSSLVIQRAHFNVPCSPSSVSFYLELLLLSSLYSLISQDNTPLCLISQAAYLPCLSLWSNDCDRGCYLSPPSALSRSLTFTIGFRSVHSPAVMQDQFCVWLDVRKTAYKVCSLETRLGLLLWHKTPRSSKHLNSFKDRSLIGNICWRNPREISLVSPKLLLCN